MKTSQAEKLLRPLTIDAAGIAGVAAWADGSMIAAVFAFAAVALAWMRRAPGETDD